MEGHVRARRSGRADERCPFCHDLLVGLDEAATWTCPACATRHHLECAREHEGCSILGCRGQGREALAAGMSAGARAQGRFALIAAVAVVLFLLAGGALGWPRSGATGSSPPGTGRFEVPKAEHPGLESLGRWERPVDGPTRGSRVVAVTERADAVRAYAIGGTRGLESCDATGRDPHVQALPRFSHPGLEVAISPDGRRGLVWNEGSGGIFEVELPSGQLRSTVSGAPDALRRAAFLPDGDRVLIVGRDGALTLLRVPDQRVLWERSSAIVSRAVVAVSPDGRRAVLGGGHSLELWELGRGRRLDTCDLGWTVRELAWSPDGGALLASTAARGGRCPLVEVEVRDRLDPLREHRLGDDPAGTLTWGPRPREATAETAGNLVILNLDTGAVRDAGVRVPAEGAVAFSRDGRRAVVKGERDGPFRSVNLETLESIAVGNAEARGAHVRGDDRPGSGVVALAHSPDGIFAVTAGPAGNVEVWALGRGEPMSLPPLPGVARVVVSKGGDRVLAADEDGGVWFADTAEGPWELVSRGERGAFRTLGFAGLDTPTSAEVFVTRRGHKVAIERGPGLEGESGWGARFPLPDGRTLRVAEDHLALATREGKEEARVVLAGRATCAALSPDQQTLWVGTSLGLERFRVP